MDTLGKLFGTTARVKVLRLFLLNPGESFSLGSVAERARILPTVARREVSTLESVGLVKRANERRRRGRGGVSFRLDEGFAYREALQGLLLNAPLQVAEIRGRLHQVGALKLVIIAGLFLGDFDGRIDMFLVGDRIKETKLTLAIKALEASLGKEIRYALLSTADFRYRLGLYDRLIRDVFDYRHKVVLDRLNIHLPG